MSKTTATNEKEKRLMEVRLAENVDDGKMIVEGYAVRFNEPAVMWQDSQGNDYKEVITRDALNDSDLSDVPFKYNHSDQVMIMARTRNKTLQLMVDEHGLFIRAELADTTTGRDLYTLIKRGDIDKMSFAFTVSEDAYNRDTRTRTISKIDKLFDVAAVDFPAYDTTSISARNYFEAEKEAIDREKRSQKETLLLKIKLGGITDND